MHCLKKWTDYGTSFYFHAPIKGLHWTPFLPADQNPSQKSLCILLPHSWDCHLQGSEKYRKSYYIGVHLPYQEILFLNTVPESLLISETARHPHDYHQVPVTDHCLIHHFSYKQSATSPPYHFQEPPVCSLQYGLQHVYYSPPDSTLSR